MVALQIRDVPDEMRDDLAAAAADQGVSLQVYLRGVIERAAASAHNRSLVAKWAERPPLASGREVNIVQLIADSRAQRDAQILNAVLGTGDE